MRKIIFVGRAGCGKTTLTQALRGNDITYQKTQYINHYDVIIDTPGEYAENKLLARALALFSFEADVVGLLISATESYSLYPPNIASCANRPVVGIVTQIDRPMANVRQAELWLRIAGCTTVFFVDSCSGDGVYTILEYLREPDDILPWQ